MKYGVSGWSVKIIPIIALFFIFGVCCHAGLSSCLIVSFVCQVASVQQRNSALLFG